MTPILYQFIGLIAGFLLWAFLGYMGKVPLEPLIALLQMALGGLITHMLKEMGASAAPKAEAGFASVRMMITLVAVALGLSMLSGCASLENAGHSSFDVKANAAGGYDLSTKDGKEFAEGRMIMFEAATGKLVVQEGPSKAFSGQALAVKAVNVLPTMGLGDILAPRDK
jgi:hypothetical protein